MNVKSLTRKNEAGWVEDLPLTSGVSAARATTRTFSAKARRSRPRQARRDVGTTEGSPLSVHDLASRVGVEAGSRGASGESGLLARPPTPARSSWQPWPTGPSPSSIVARPTKTRAQSCTLFRELIENPKK